MRTSILFAIAFAISTPSQAQTVSAFEGNLLYQASPGAPGRQLTSTGLDRDPVLSPDGQTVAFIRDTPGDGVEILIGPEAATELWIIRVDGTDARMVLKGRSRQDGREALALLHGPRFSPDGSRIYVLSAAWANAAAVHEVDLASGRDRFVVAGNSLDVVQSGEYTGHLIVQQHRYFLGGGAYDFYWLVTPQGEVVDPIGEDEMAVEEFRAMYIEP